MHAVHWPKQASLGKQGAVSTTAHLLAAIVATPQHMQDVSGAAVRIIIIIIMLPIKP
jgi:hypothetical protein